MKSAVHFFRLSASLTTTRLVASRALLIVWHMAFTAFVVVLSLGLQITARADDRPSASQGATRNGRMASVKRDHSAAVTTAWCSVWIPHLVRLPCFILSTAGTDGNRWHCFKESTATSTASQNKAVALAARTDVEKSSR